MFEVIKIIKYLIILGITNKIIHSVYNTIKILKKIKIDKKLLLLLVLTLLPTLIKILITLNILEYKTIELHL